MAPSWIKHAVRFENSCPQLSQALTGTGAFGLLLAEKALSQDDKDPINEIDMCTCMHTGKYTQLCIYVQLRKQIYIQSLEEEKVTRQL